ncbi:MAG: hypothetical protein ABIS48_03075 [Candidatus Saccharimonadales bacterium]
MSKVKIDQKGFGAVEILVGFVLVLLIVAAGFYVTHANTQKPPIHGDTTAQNNFLAFSNVGSIASALESIYAVNGAYPSDIEQTTFDAANQRVGFDALKVPDGTKYVYTPAPAGCTTDAKDCKSFTLTAISISDNKTIKTETSEATN